ncbi:hypothetical protein M758_N019800 [Ceratodon purpureus]|nr:hypothetical protein M758_N019800 [Ceratodon purpureus]
MSALSVNIIGITSKLSLTNTTLTNKKYHRKQQLTQQRSDRIKPPRNRVAVNELRRRLRQLPGGRLHNAAAVLLHILRQVPCHDLLSSSLLSTIDLPSGYKSTPRPPPRGLRSRIGMAMQ